MSKRKTERIRYAIVSDTHGDAIDPRAEREFYEFLDDYQPDKVIHLGDAFDLRALRRGASDSEAAETLEADVLAGIEFLRRINPAVWCMGNHDDRLHVIAKTHPKGVVREYAAMVLDRIESAIPETKIIPYGDEAGLVRMADMLLLHGCRANLSTARQIAQEYNIEGVRHVIQGHVHRFSSETARTYNQVTGRTMGGLCKRVMDYNRHRAATKAHENGWLYGEIVNGRASINEYKLDTQREPIHVVC